MDKSLSKSSPKLDADENQTLKDVVIFSDGASRGNPGPGGWGAIVVIKETDKSPGKLSTGVSSSSTKSGKVYEIGGREIKTTNNRMELEAVIGGLSFLSDLKKKLNSVVIYTDSSYVLKGATQWLLGWEQKGWQTKGKTEVLNKELWQSLSVEIKNVTQLNGKDIDWRLLAGHVGVVGNERADEIATAFADNKNPELFAGPFEKYTLDILNVSANATQKAERSDSKSRSRAQAYSYISKVGGVIQIHKTWAECEARVRGAKGALYKKALSPEEERGIVALFQGK